MIPQAVVAVVRQAVQKYSFTLYHKEFLSLRPHELIIGEVMECYIQVILNSKENSRKMYLLNHYTIGVILNGTREQMARQGLKEVNFDAYDAIIGFVNMWNVHWKFVYLHALSEKIFVIDPLEGPDEVEDSRQAAYKFGQYFNMRRNRLGKEDWVKVKWQPGNINHTFRKDATSCGVFVMQMAKMAIKEFPDLPLALNIGSSKEATGRIRREMAEELISGSAPKDAFCAFCGKEESPKDIDVTVWIQCGFCTRWFHTLCLGIQAAQIPRAEDLWLCVMCDRTP